MAMERGGKSYGTVTYFFPWDEGFDLLGGFTWMHLSACVPHAQAGRMSMDVSYSMRSYGTLT